jgi:FolB domain-containing protein
MTSRRLHDETPPPDRVLISGLRVRCIVGVNDWERLVPQEIEMDIELLASLRRAGQTDRIEDTVNYRSVTKRVVAAAEGSKFRLVEALAEEVARVCLGEGTLVQAVSVTVRKPGAVRGANWVGVKITRTRADFRGRNSGTSEK